MWKREESYVWVWVYRGGGAARGRSVDRALRKTLPPTTYNMIKSHMLLFPPPNGAGSGKSAKQNRVEAGGGQGRVEGGGRAGDRFSVKKIAKYAPYQTVSVGLLFVSVQSKHRNCLFRYRSETTETNVLFRIVPKIVSVPVSVVSNRN